LCNGTSASSRRQNGRWGSLTTISTRGAGARHRARARAHRTIGVSPLHDQNCFGTARPSASRVSADTRWPSPPASTTAQSAPIISQTNPGQAASANIGYHGQPGRRRFVAAETLWGLWAEISAGRDALPSATALFVEASLQSRPPSRDVKGSQHGRSLPPARLRLRRSRPCAERTHTPISRRRRATARRSGEPAGGRASRTP